MKKCSTFETFIAEIFEYRKSAMSQSDVATAAGVPIGKVSSIERKPGHLLRVSELESYISGLGIQVQIAWEELGKPAAKVKSPTKAPVVAAAAVYSGSVESEPEEFQPPDDAVWDNLKGMWFSADAGCYYNEDGEEIPIES